MPNLVEKDRFSQAKLDAAERRDKKVLEIIAQMEREGYSWGRSGKDSAKAEKELERRYKESKVRRPQDSMKIKSRY